MGDKNKISFEMPEDDGRPITKLHIPYEMIIDPDRPRKYEKGKTPPITAVRWCCSVAAWLLIVSGALFMLLARPHGFNFFVYLKGFTQNPVWDSSSLVIARFMIAGSSLISFAESAFLFIRHRLVYLSLVLPLAASAVLMALSFFL